MFLVLTIVNIPVYFMYASQTRENDYANLTELFGYFTIGNLGQTWNECDYSEVYLASDEIQMSDSMRKLTWVCPPGTYISSLNHFGFLYQEDRRLRRPSHGRSSCWASMHPTDEDDDATMEEADRAKQEKYDALVAAEQAEPNTLEGIAPVASHGQRRFLNNSQHIDQASNNNEEQIDDSIPSHLRDIIKISTQQ